MKELTPQQDKRLRKAKEVAKRKGDLAILAEIFDLEDKIDNEIPSIKEVINRVKGDKGETGEMGLQGPQGIVGPQGPQGNEGRAGKDGRNGLDGKSGKDGRDGRDGRDGLDGEHGEDGSPDSSEDIRNKLELLTGDERLDAKFIKNLPAGVREVIREGWHAGAMETPIKDSNGRLLSKDASGAWKLPATGTGGGQVNSVVAGSGISVDSTDPANPIVSVTGSSTSFVDNEIVSGSGTTFTLANTPIVGTEHIFALGQRLYPGGVDYTISGAVITPNSAWNAGMILADYRK